MLMLQTGSARCAYAKN